MPITDTSAFGDLNSKRFSCSPALDAAVKETLARKIGSNVSTRNSPQSPALSGVAAPIAGPCAVGGNTHHTSTTSSPTRTKPSPRRSQSLQAAVERLGGSFLKPWRSLWRHEQINVASEAAGQHGGLAFTLNLSLNREAFIKHRNDPLDDMRRYIGRELRNHFGTLLPFAFTFEIGPKAGRVHIHGVLIPPSNSAECRKLLRLALARAGGKITGRGAARQVDLMPLTDGTGWAAYSQKDYDTACHYLGTGEITFVSTDLKRIARDFLKR